MGLSRILRTATAAVALLLVSSCGGDELSATDARVTISFYPASDGSYTATVNGKSFTGSGKFALSLPELGKTYELSGSFTGGSLGINFGTTTTSGVRAGSVTSVAGPNPAPYNCGVNYFATGGGTNS